MIERLPRTLLIAAGVLIPLVLAYAAFSRPGYFISQTYLGGLILFELLAAAVWMYRRAFFPIVLISFLFAGVDLPVGTVWTAARWVFLAAGSLVGLFIMLKERSHRFGLFHLMACFAVLMALVSAAVSHYEEVSLLKVLSLFLLLLYAATGARLAVTGREDRFFNGLLIGCEIFVGANAMFYALGTDAMGNPNSLGAVMGVACAPILLWGALLGGAPSTQHRRWAMYAVCIYLAFESRSRAGLATALLSSGFLCLALRKYKLAIQGSVVVLILVATTAIVQPEAASSFFSTAVYKNGDQQTGLLASRESPWHDAVESIRDHPWFGMGFGTTATGEEEDAGAHPTFSSSIDVTAEHGSSYLAISSGVGLLGALPFALLLILLAGKMLRTVAWMRMYGSPSHPAVPLAVVVFAGLVHASFEDWMFAPGYHLCVFYWSLAFILVDLAPTVHIPGFAWQWHSRPTNRLGVVAPGR